VEREAAGLGVVMAVGQSNRGIAGDSAALGLLEIDRGT
jgi:hypothetical protein